MGQQATIVLTPGLIAAMMKTLFTILCSLLVVALLALGQWPGQNSSAQSVAVPVVAGAFEVEPMRQGVLYSYTLPASLSSRVAVGYAPGRLLVTGFYEQNGHPELVVNAGFFDPVNGKTTSYVAVDGKWVGDPAANERLTGNAGLQKYLPQVFNRTEFRIYDCDARPRFEIAPHNAPVPEGCRLKDAVGAGPRLLPELTARQEAFLDYDTAGRVTRDPIGVCKPNARTAIGLTPDGSLIILVGAQHPDNATSGFTLEEMARLLKARGATQAMAFDGGGSSSLVYQGKAYFGEFEKDGSPARRPVKSALLIRGP